MVIGFRSKLEIAWLIGHEGWNFNKLKKTSLLCVVTSSTVISSFLTNQWYNVVGAAVCGFS